MVGLGVLMILFGLWSQWLRWRGRLHEHRGFLRMALWMGPTGLIALLAGWFTTEIGRQPWVVYGLMRTADAATPHTAAQLSVTLALFVVSYLFVFGVGIAYTCSDWCATGRSPTRAMHSKPMPSRPPITSRPGRSPRSTTTCV